MELPDPFLIAATVAIIGAVLWAFHEACKVMNIWVIGICLIVVTIAYAQVAGAPNADPVRVEAGSDQ